LEVYLVVLDRLLRATTKKRSRTFLRRKVQTKSRLRLCYSLSFVVEFLRRLSWFFQETSNTLLFHLRRAASSLSLLTAIALCCIGGSTE